MCDVNSQATAPRRTYPMRSWLALLLAGVLLIASEYTWALNIVLNGQAATGIVIPDSEIPVEQYAANEFRDHIRKATGATLAIVRESQIPPGASGYIYIGATNAATNAGLTTSALQPNQFINKVVGANLYICGKDSPGLSLQDSTHAGSLFGVYDFLETQMGVKWLWPGESGEVVHQRTNLAIHSLDRNVAPAMVHTRLRLPNLGTDPAAGGWATVQQRDDFNADQLVWLRRQRLARAVSLDAKHSFSEYWQQYGASHPEYFQLLPDGTRRPDPLYFNGAPQLVAMNVSDAGLRNQIIQQWQATRSGFEPYVDASENDTPGRDLTPASLAMDVRDPSLSDAQWNNRVALATQAYNNGESDWYRHLGQLSDRYAKFYMSVLNDARAVDPNAKVLGLAYQNYTKAPLSTQLDEDVIIPYTVPMSYPWTSAKRQAVLNDWANWNAAGASMMLRPNYLLEGHNLPVYIAEQFGEDFSAMYAAGMYATDFDSLTGQWGTQGPTLYVAARLQRDPQLPVQQVLDEYYSGFGAAEAQVRQYFAHWRQVSEAVTESQISSAVAERNLTDFGWQYYHRIGDEIFTPAIMSQGRALMTAALSAASSDLKVQQRVAFLEKGLRHAELTIAAQTGFDRLVNQGDFRPYVESIKLLDAYRRTIGDDGVSNLGFLYWAESLSWNRNVTIVSAGAAIAVDGDSITDSDVIAGNTIFRFSDQNDDNRATIVIDLGDVKTVDKFLFENRKDAASNFHLRDLQIRIAPNENAVSFDPLRAGSFTQTIFSGTLSPSSINADLTRIAELTNVNRRYFLIRMTNNFFGSAEDIHIGDIGVVAIPEPAAGLGLLLVTPLAIRRHERRIKCHG